jgi:hypothetical protein
LFSGLFAPLSAGAYSQPYYQGGYILNNPTEDMLLGINAIGNHFISTYNGSSQPLDALLADVYFVDGTALSAETFAALDSNGIWKPIDFNGTLGYQGFRLDFSSTGFSDFSPSNGSVMVGPLSQTTTFRLICTAQDIGSLVETNATVFVDEEAGLTLTACDVQNTQCSSSPNTPVFVQSGQSAKLTWNAVGFDPSSCNVTYGGVTLPPAFTNQASNVGTPAITSEKTYILQCLLNGDVSSTTVRVGIKDSCETGSGSAGFSCSSKCALKSDVLEVEPGESATISWCCPAGPAAGTNFATGGSLSGTVSVSPSTNTTYSLSCGSGSGSVSLIALKPPAILNSFSATRVRRGGQSTLSWTVARMSEEMYCTISPTPAGSQPDGSPGTWVGSTLSAPVYSPTTYTLTCGSDEAGYVSASATANLLPAFIER